MTTITLDKAVEILEDLLGEGPYFHHQDRRDAITLAIKALTCIQYLHFIALSGTPTVRQAPTK